MQALSAARRWLPRSPHSGAWIARTREEEALGGCFDPEFAPIDKLDAGQRQWPVRFARGCRMPTVVISALTVIALLLGGAAQSRAAEPFEGRSIVDSARKGDLASVRQHLANRVDPNTQDAQGLTALNHAAYLGHLAIVRELVEHGANVNVSSNAGRLTPLMNAAYRGHAEVVRYLLDHGANSGLRDKDGNSASDYAAAGGYATLAESLLPKEVRDYQIRAANCRRESEARSGREVTLTGTIRIRYDGLAHNPVDVPVSITNPVGWWCQGEINEVPIRAISGDRVCRSKSPATVSGKLVILPKPAACRPEIFDPMRCPFPELPDLAIKDARVSCR